MNEEIKVSICCLAYNHEKYIEKALMGFLSQQTQFRYEIIVNDDASTDKTASIIRNYERLYPEIIKPIYQKENQFSKGISILDTYVYPKAEGKYIAVCEGDDYWIDPLKLQKQVDYMDKNPDCTFCFTNGWIDNMQTNNRRKFIPYSKADEKYFYDGSKDYTLKNMYEVSFAPTASYLFKKIDLNKLPETYYKRVPAGDLKTRLYFTALGYAHFIDEKTCVYRENVPNSVMTRWRYNNRKEIYDRSVKIVNMINEVDKYAEYKYTEELDNIKKIHVETMLQNAPTFYVLENKDCRRIFKKFSVLKKCKIIVKIMLPEKILKLLKTKRSGCKE